MIGCITLIALSTPISMFTKVLIVFSILRTNETRHNDSVVKLSTNRWQRDNEQRFEVRGLSNERVLIVDVCDVLRNRQR